MQDVAARAGVSRSLVSLVMHDSPKVSVGSRRAVLQAADELGYRPNLMARNLDSRRTMTIGLVLNDLHNPFFAETADGIYAAANEAGYQVVINSGLRSGAGESRAVDTFLQFQVDGIILVGPRLGAEELSAVAAETELVVVGRACDSERFDSVSVDEHMGAGLVVDHLVSLGHARIAHIDGGDGAGAAERRAGYVRAMHDHGLGERVRIVAGAYTGNAGTDGAAELLGDKDPPTAIFAANDLIAAGALGRLGDEGLSVPEDLSVVGFDNTALASLYHLSLTSVNQPREVIGEMAAACLRERLDAGRSQARHQLVAPTLVARTSSGPAPADVCTPDRDLALRGRLRQDGS